MQRTLFCCVFVGLFPSITLFGDEIDTQELLDKYCNAVNQMDCFESTFNLSSWVEDQDEPNIKKYYSTTSCRYRRMGQNTEWIKKDTIYDGNNPVKELFSGDIASNEKYFTMKALPQSKYLVRAYSPDNDKLVERKKDLLASCNYGSFLCGRIFGNNGLCVSELLRQSKNISINESAVMIGEYECIELKGSTKWGEISVWVNPLKNYNAMKWCIKKNENYLFDKKKLKEVNCKEWTATYEISKIKQYGEIYVPVEGQVTLFIEELDGKKNTTYYTFSVDHFQYKPDFENLKAFTVHAFNLPDGTKIHDESIPGIPLLYINGSLVPEIDEFALDVIENTAIDLKNEEVFKKSPPQGEIKATEHETAFLPEQKPVTDDFVVKSNSERSHAVYIVIATIIVISFSAMIMMRKRNV